MSASRPRRRVIVTRPAREAARWVDALAARGIDAVALPLIEIAPTASGSAPPIDPGPYAALMFVSAPAVDGFFGSNRAEAPADRAHVAIEKIASARCWAPGPGTVQALEAAGVPPHRIDQPASGAPQLDSEALWAQVRPQVRAGTRVLLVRGGDAQGRATGRDWLARAIAEAGGETDTCVVYRRLPPQLDAESLALAHAGTDGRDFLWLFSSSEAVAHLRAALSGADWSQAHALATHPRIAEAARAAGFGIVAAVPPHLEPMVASIESIR